MSTVSARSGGGCSRDAGSYRFVHRRTQQSGRWSAMCQFCGCQTCLHSHARRSGLKKCLLKSAKHIESADLYAQTPNTPSVTLIVALGGALQELLDEGLENCILRYRLTKKDSDGPGLPLWMRSLPVLKIIAWHPSARWCLQTLDENRII
jgi:hypothetical protein